MRRGLASILAAAALLGAAPAADAGIYEVRACGSVAGGAQNAFAASDGPMMSAYSICPPSSGVGTGIVTKASSNGGRAPYGAGAYQVFTAPPGTELADVTFNVGAIRLSGDWSVGIVAFDGDWDAGDYPYGCYPWNSYCGIGTPVFSISASVNLFSHSRFRFQTRCVSPAGCDTSASPFSPANRALFSAANVTVRVRDVVAPTVTPHHGALWGSGWHRGREEAWTSYADGSGVMLSRIYVDGVVRKALDYRDTSMPDWARCDFTRPRPCVDFVPGGLDVDTATLADGTHRIDVEAVDAAGNSAQAGQAIRVDNSIPAKPEGVAVSGGEGWRSANRFELGWANPPGQVAPIARARYRICRAGGGGDCSEGSADGEQIAALALRVPDPGEWVARVWLEDAAANQDPGRAGDAVRLRFDDEAPTAVFEEADARDPRTVRVRVADVGSGAADGSIELRRIGSGTWLDAGGRVAGARLETRIDDLGLPDGTYELRARVRDAAGNERTGTRRADGSPMRLVLPLRAGTRLAVAATRRCGRRARRCARRIRNGTKVAGRLSANGVPVRHATVSVTSQLRTGGGFARVGSLRTDARGSFTYRVGSGASRTLRFRWDGTDTEKPAVAEARVGVPARTSIGVDRRRVRNGEAVTFGGRLLGRPLPEGGKLVDLQVRLRGRWRTFATPRTDRAGRWSFAYRFEATRGLVVYSFRARIRREAAYPYELGHSRIVRVTVRG